MLQGARGLGKGCLHRLELLERASPGFRRLGFRCFRWGRGVENVRPRGFGSALVVLAWDEMLRVGVGENLRPWVQA